MQVLEARWSENIPLTSLASAANLSPYHFARTFKQSTGLAPQEYHRQLRMSKAKELLVQTPLSITDIALRVGYSSSQAFSRFFRRDTGLTPHEYRHYGKDGRTSRV
ncbi:MAG: helix-turn-helix domain-containing protein [Rhodospirillaceae bacterium]